jgi:hypothetical protein
MDWARARAIDEVTATLRRRNPSIQSWRSDDH